MKDSELLQFVYKTAEMGIVGLRGVQEHIRDEQLRRAVQKQLAEYREISRSSGGMLRERGQEPKGPGVGARLSSELSSTAKTLVDPSASKIAEMIIQGSTMGITKGTKHLNDYAGGDDSVRRLAETLIQTEHGNIEQMKPFL